jgi:hypothetical protein
MKTGRWGFAGLAVCVLAAAVLSGCAKPRAVTCKTEYEFHPPTSYEGKMCLMKCEKERKQCRDDKELQYKNCEHHGRMVRLEFERCIASGATNCYSAVAPPCERPCDSSGPCSDSCNMEYRHCYESCGGSVTSKEVCNNGCDSWTCD